MSIKDEIFSYPEEMKDQFLETNGLTFMDGSHVSASDIWQYMTEEAPRKFPYAFNTSPNSITRLPYHAEFSWSIKYLYLVLSFRDRMLEAKRKGVPVVFVQGGQTLEPYYAAGAIPLRPYFVILWAQNMQEGLGLRQLDWRSMSFMEEGRRTVSMEACHQIGAHAAIDNGVVDIDLIAPYLCLRCSDMAYLTEAHRSNKRRTPAFLVDYPVNHQLHKGWTVKYVADTLRRLVQRMGEMGGREVTEEDLRASIRLINRARRLARDCVEMWWDAPIPPASSIEIHNVITLGNDFAGDPEAGLQILQEAYTEIKERVEHSVKGADIAEDPVRIFMCGSCVTPNPHHIDRSGGVVIGYDDWWNRLLIDVEEEGDPYESLAKAMLSFPYELPTEERAMWTAQQAKRARAHGLIFAYNWGCNNQSAVARMVCDIVKKEAGIPTMALELGELGRLEAIEQSQNRVEAFIEMLNISKNSTNLHRLGKIEPSPFYFLECVGKI